MEQYLKELREENRKEHERKMNRLYGVACIAMMVALCFLFAAGIMGVRI